MKLKKPSKITAVRIGLFSTMAAIIIYAGAQALGYKEVEKTFMYVGLITLTGTAAIDMFYKESKG